ncbi:MAG: hypothetical protein IPH93_06070 [Saprospiraceae bacterium]|nr:hypothetical protein [Saprospiraceae bacterium]
MKKAIRKPEMQRSAMKGLGSAFFAAQRNEGFGKYFFCSAAQKEVLEGFGKYFFWSTAQ